MHKISQLLTETYNTYLQKIPHSGQHILGQQVDDQIVVYQAFNPQIAKFAVEHQCFGGAHYSYNRMSWIKPNFLWMMYRCGWADKDNQKNVLAIWIKTSDFDTILREAVYSSYKKSVYPTMETWRADLAEKEVRLQWDPDHDPYGKKQERRAIQLGLKGDILKKFGTEMILHIEDISDFVRTQKNALDTGGLDALMVPQEQIYLPNDKYLNIKLEVI